MTDITWGEPPFVLVVREPPTVPDRVQAIHLDGASMRTVDAVFDAFATHFEFPDYFGRNWDAFDECLLDLDWLPKVDRAIVISDAHLVLADEPPDQLPILLAALDRAGSEFYLPIDYGETWDRPALAFNTVLVVPEGEELAAQPVDPRGALPPKRDTWGASRLRMLEAVVMGAGVIWSLGSRDLRYVLEAIIVVLVLRSLYILVTRRGRSK